MKNKYAIWTKGDEKDDKPYLFDEYPTLQSMGDVLDLSVAQVRERMSWSGGKTLGVAWQIKSGFRYQILIL
jgi:hypothetical protein